MEFKRQNSIKEEGVGKLGRKGSVINENDENGLEFS